MTEEKIREVVDRFAEEAKKYMERSCRRLFFMVPVPVVILKMTVI